MRGEELHCLLERIDVTRDGRRLEHSHLVGSSEFVDVTQRRLAFALGACCTNAPRSTAKRLREDSRGLGSCCQSHRVPPVSSQVANSREPHDHPSNNDLDSGAEHPYYLRLQRGWSARAVRVHLLYRVNPSSSSSAIAPALTASASASEITTSPRAECDKSARTSIQARLSWGSRLPKKVNCSGIVGPSHSDTRPEPTPALTFQLSRKPSFRRNFAVMTTFRWASRRSSNSNSLLAPYVRMPMTTSCHLRCLQRPFR